MWGYVRPLDCPNFPLPTYYSVWFHSSPHSASLLPKFKPSHSTSRWFTLHSCWHPRCLVHLDFLGKKQKKKYWSHPFPMKKKKRWLTTELFASFLRSERTEIKSSLVDRVMSLSGQGREDNADQTEAWISPRPMNCTTLDIWCNIYNEGHVMARAGPALRLGMFLFRLWQEQPW